MSRFSKKRKNMSGNEEKETITPLVGGEQPSSTHVFIPNTPEKVDKLERLRSATIDSLNVRISELLQVLGSSRDRTIKAVRW